MSRKAATTSVGIGLGVVASLGFASFIAGRRAVPSWSGTVVTPTLDAPVEVMRDRWGIPSVWADGEDDLFFVQGYLHASDRLFQMDLMRRIGYGRLAEVAGSKGVTSDRLMRVLGFGRSADEEYGLLEDASRRILDRYADGVNHYMTTASRRLPVEFKAMRYRPRPWKPSHSLVFSRLMALGLCGNWEAELVRAEVAARFGVGVLRDLDDSADCRPFPAQIGIEMLGELVSAARGASELFGGVGGAGSNNWVIGPRRTASGGALLANDPHLDLLLPSIWYENVLRCPTFNARGFTIVGVPGVVLGHNGTLGWGFTNSCADVQDLYVEDVDPAAGTYRDTDGESHPLSVRSERIVVRDEKAQVLDVRSTRRGPILTDVVNTTLEYPVSMRWDAIRPGLLMEAMLGMCRASNIEEFREALRGWTAPSQNVVVADIHGNIAYQLVGEIPIRATGNGTMPQRGDDPDAEWTSIIPFEELPWSLNPSSDCIVTANDKLVDDGYPHFISCEWMNGYRGVRIRELIDREDHHDAPYQSRIQSDIRSLAGEQMVGAIRSLDVCPAPTTDAGRDVLELLLSWDFDLREDDEHADAWRIFLRALQEQVFGFLGDLAPSYLGYSRTAMNGYWSMFQRSTPRLIHDIRAGDESLLELGLRVSLSGSSPERVHEGGIRDWEPSGSWGEALARALDYAGVMLRDSGLRPLRFGGETTLAPPGLREGVGRRVRGALRPRWRSTHRIRFQHPLGSVAPLSPMVNRGPFVVPGDTDTVWQSSPFHSAVNDHAMVGPSQRTVIDFADLDASTAVLAGGQSGHPASPQYADQLAMWRSGESRPAPWSRESLSRQAVFRQRFEP